MILKYKLTIEELATMYQLVNDLDGRQSRLNKAATVSMSIYIFFKSIYFFNAYTFKGAIMLILPMLLILATFLFFSINPTVIRKRMIKVAKKNVTQTPQLLEWRTIEIDDNYITCTKSNSSTKIKINCIIDIINKNEVIFVFDNMKSICAVIPVSAFKTSEDKSKFLNLLKKT